MPTEFDFNQSSEQKFYIFIDADIGGEPLELGEDWVAAFKGDLCVGARQWDTSFCGNGVCDLPIMGESIYESWTEG